MIVYLKDLQNIKDEKTYEFFIEEIVIENNPFIRKIVNCDGYFIFYYEGDQLKIEYRMKGQMICPDAYTLEDVEVDFDEEEVEDVTTDNDCDGILLSTKNEASDIIKQVILPIVPIKVVKNSK